MKTTLLIVGVLLSVFAVIHTHDSAESLPSQFITGATATQKGKPVVWELSISGNADACTTSFISSLDNLVTSMPVEHCEHMFPDLQYLKSIQTDANGDIELYRQDGSKLARFMESESSDHESFWPPQPLMTLARVK